MQADYLIVGQGLAGSMLAYKLLQSHKSVIAIDIPDPESASRVAAGLFNPITGKKVVKTWLAESLFPSLVQFYTEAEHELKSRFLHLKPIFRPFSSISEQNEWYAKSGDDAYKKYLTVQLGNTIYSRYYDAPYGGLHTHTAGYLEVPVFLEHCQKYIQSNATLLHQPFVHKHLTQKDHKWIYENIVVEKVIFCEGIGVKNNPYFTRLPMPPTKGEILDVEIDRYTISDVVNKGIFILPTKTGVRVGATYEWDFEHSNPTDAGKKELTDKLKVLIKTDFIVTGHRAAVRPTVADRRPILGKHPLWDNLYIFNGLGTKGVSLAPYFSQYMCKYLINNEPLMPEVDVARFYPFLVESMNS